MGNWGWNLVRICVCVALGAMINIAVAWGIATLAPITLVSRFVDQPSAEDQQWWRNQNAAQPNSEVKAVWRHRGAGIESRMILGNSASIGHFGASANDRTFYASTTDRFDRAHDVSSGWPLPALQGSIWHFDVTLMTSIPIVGQTGTFALVNGQHAAAWQFKRPGWLGGTSYRLLPFAPTWPGFAINTIFYAAIMWALFALPFAIRRRLRIKLGQCAACGYSLRGHESAGNKCPECGTPS